MSLATIEDEIEAVKDRLVHLHAAIDLVLPRVGQTTSAEGVRRELRSIADGLLEEHNRLHCVLERIRARQES